MTNVMRVIIELSALAAIACLIVGLHIARRRQAQEHYQALAAQCGRWMDETRAAHATQAAQINGKATEIHDMKEAARALGDIARLMRVDLIPLPGSEEAPQ